MAQWGAVVTFYNGREALPRCLLTRQRPSKWAVDKKPVVREIHSIKQAAEFSWTTRSMQQWRDLLVTQFQHEARVTQGSRLWLGEANSAIQGSLHELLISGTPGNENHFKSCWYGYIRKSRRGNIYSCHLQKTIWPTLLADGSLSWGLCCHFPPLKADTMIIFLTFHALFS